jgi:rubredoxin
MKEVTMKKWDCEICGYVYDESIGSLRDGVAEGTAFTDLPEDWVCPDCQMGKEYFVQQETLSI